jgi:hypothetical protein
MMAIFKATLLPGTPHHPDTRYGGRLERLVFERIREEP